MTSEKYLFVPNDRLFPRKSYERIELGRWIRWGGYEIGDGKNESIGKPFWDNGEAYLQAKSTLAGVTKIISYIRLVQQTEANENTVWREEMDVMIVVVESQLNKVEWNLDVMGKNADSNLEDIRKENAEAHDKIFQMIANAVRVGVHGRRPLQQRYIGQENQNFHLPQDKMNNNSNVIQQLHNGNCTIVGTSVESSIRQMNSLMCM